MPLHQGRQSSNCLWFHAFVEALLDTARDLSSQRRYVERCRSSHAGGNRDSCLVSGRQRDWRAEGAACGIGRVCFCCQKIPRSAKKLSLQLQIDGCKLGQPWLLQSSLAIMSALAMGVKLSMSSPRDASSGLTWGGTSLWLRGGAMDSSAARQYADAAATAEEQGAYRDG